MKPYNGQSVPPNGNQTYSSQQSKEPPQDPDDEPEEEKHPFYKVGLHIVGWGEYTELGKLTKNYYLSASQNGQHVFDLSLRDLLLAGYAVSVRSGCVIEIKYKKFHDFLTCDSPAVKVFDDDSDLSDT